MNIATYSPVLVLLFVFALLWILMDIRFRELSPVQKWVVPILVLLLAGFNHVLRQEVGIELFGKLIILTMHIPFFLIFLFLAKRGIAKTLFMILSAVIFTAPTVILSTYVRLLLPDSSMALLGSNLISYAITLLLAQFVFRSGFNYLLEYGEDRLFVSLSLIPFLYYIYYFAIRNIDLSSFTSLSGFIVRYIPTFEVFVFVFLLMHNYKELSQRKELENAQTALVRELSAVEEQIHVQNEAHTQTAMFQHNMRHHLNVIENFLSAGKIEHAEEYIKSVYSEVEAITPKRYCENEIVNLICSSFSSKAERLGIHLTVEAKVPKLQSIPDTQLCTVLSNGLDNAFHAVSSLQYPHKWVKFYCKVQMNKLLIEIKNPHAGKITMRDGFPLTIQAGHGYGCRSIYTITERNCGLCSFESKDNIFTLRVMLPVHDNEIHTTFIT